MFGDLNHAKKIINTGKLYDKNHFKNTNNLDTVINKINSGNKKTIKH